MIEAAAAWWTSERGVFVNFEKVMPFVSIHLPPLQSSTAMTPYIIGPASLQAEVIGSDDPAVMKRNLLEMCPDYAANLVAPYRHAFENNELVHDFSRFTGVTTAGSFDFIYERLLMPVRTTTGHQMIATLTRKTTQRWS